MNSTANIVLITGDEADIFQAIKDSGALKIFSGKVTLNFHNGVLQNVVKEELMWKR